MANTRLLEMQAMVDKVFSALEDALPEVDFTVYDTRGYAYILDFDENTSLLLQAESYSPLSEEMEMIAIGDEDR